MNTATDDIVIKCEHRNSPAVIILGTIVDFMMNLNVLLVMMNVPLVLHYVFYSGLFVTPAYSLRFQIP